MWTSGFKLSVLSAGLHQHRRQCHHTMSVPIINMSTPVPSCSQQTGAHRTSLLCSAATRKHRGLGVMFLWNGCVLPFPRLAEIRYSSRKPGLKWCHLAPCGHPSWRDSSMSDRQTCPLCYLGVPMCRSSKIRVLMWMFQTLIAGWLWSQPRIVGSNS